MKPAFSVIFLTTLIGAAQGLMLAAVSGETLARLQGLQPDHAFYLASGVAALLLSGLGLLASFFHLGHPERAWRAACMWRTSWLSREVIALPAFMAATFGYAVAHYLGAAGATTLTLGIASALLAIVLFVCTGMIYAAIRVLREWAHPYTVINFILLGSASGATLAAVLAVPTAPEQASGYACAATVLTVLALIGRSAALWRNAKLKPVTTLQSAIGVRHPQIRQRSQGAMGGSFNTREFFHGQTDATLATIQRSFLLLAFVAPLALLWLNRAEASGILLGMAFASQYLGLLAERWFFFAEANHPQNNYYRTIG